MRYHTRKRRYEGPNGAIFVPNVSQDIIDTKVKAGEWIPRPDLDAAAEAEAAAKLKPQGDA